MSLPNPYLPACNNEEETMQPVRYAGFFAMLLGLLALSAAPSRAFEEKAFDSESFKAAQSAGKPILVDVFAPWCPTCKAQQTVLGSLQDKPAFDKLVVFKVDYDSQPDVVKSFRAQRQSTLIAYKGAAETGRSVGDTKPASIEALLMSALE
jgi:thiol-disulfide isomerase/thioredoxin